MCPNGLFVHKGKCTKANSAFVPQNETVVYYNQAEQFGRTESDVIQKEDHPKKSFKDSTKMVIISLDAPLNAILISTHHNYFIFILYFLL